MKYIAVRSDSIPSIISNRALQSADFAAGEKFADIILGAALEEYIVPGVEIVKTDSGIILFGSDSAEKKFVVFDIPQSGLYEGHSRYEVLQYIQRTLRFSIKYWMKAVRAPNEKIISARTAVVFPFSISQRNGTRIAIDLNPDVERLSKRDSAGKYVLAYKISKDPGDGADEVSSPTVLRKFIEELPSSLRAKKDGSEGRSEADRLSLNFVDVELEPNSKTVDIHQSFDTWMKLITKSQERVVYASLENPVRIEGPAGTGKTLTLLLRVLRKLHDAENANEEFQGIFFTHSEATRRSTLTALAAMGGERFLSDQPQRLRLRVETLQSYCAELLHNEIASTEFIDMDAYDAKLMQVMYIEAAIEEAQAEFDTYRKLMSTDFLNYWAEEAQELRSILVQHEVALVIKGRASEKLDVYKKIGRVKSALPVSSEGDKAFLWRIFEAYRKQLVTGAQFDTDDVAISAVSQLSAPIWRRRRFRDGFDAIMIDETHLFNMNELSVFHHLSKQETSLPITYAVDKSQAIGDRGWGENIDISSLLPSEEIKSSQQSVSVKGIFRCTPEIVNLAFSITSSGASLFSNFDDPMSLAYSQMGYDEEKKAKTPTFRSFDSDNAMVEAAFQTIEGSQKEYPNQSVKSAIIALSDEMLHNIIDIADKSNRGYEVIKSRGDYEVVSRALNAGKFVISLADYIGGLEFDEVVLLGVDAGRVPQDDGNIKAESKAYLDFAAHNRLYVAVTRARYRVTLMGLRERGPSPVLASAIEKQALLVEK
jgi:superfamily I DNA/RNA helicase